MRIGECSRVTIPKEILDRKSPKELDVLVPSEKFFKALEGCRDGGVERASLLNGSTRIAFPPTKASHSRCEKKWVQSSAYAHAQTHAQRSRRWISLTRPRK